MLCQALEKIGDSYALYAFSGSGRADVEFHVVKDFHERLCAADRPAHRPHRTGSCYAHGRGDPPRYAQIGKGRSEQPAIVALSDGRPYDRDYGRDDEDQEYAVQDTRQALLEAKRRGIRPFCLTIDRDGEDYLRQMCDDIPYEVVTKWKSCRSGWSRRIRS